MMTFPLSIMVWPGDSLLVHLPQGIDYVTQNIFPIHEENLETWVGVRS